MNTGEVGVLVENNPGQKLKPQVLLVTDSSKKARPVHSLVNLGSSSWEGVVDPPKVVRVLEPGSHGVQSLAVLRGLIGIQ